MKREVGPDQGILSSPRDVLWLLNLGKLRAGSFQTQAEALSAEAKKNAGQTEN